MWYVYIIQCSDRSLYTGLTTDIDHRAREHNSQKGGSYTRSRTPIKLVYKENYPSRIEAQKREAQIKRWSHSKKLALIEQDKAKLRRLSVSRD